MVDMVDISWYQLFIKYFVCKLCFYSFMLVQIRSVCLVNYIKGQVTVFKNNKEAFSMLH